MKTGRRRNKTRLIRFSVFDSRRLRKGCAGNFSAQPHTSVRGKVIERILCGQAVAVAVSDLLEHHGAASVENERRWISRLERRVPAQSVEVGDLVVRVSDENNVGRQLSLFLEEFL